MDRTVCGLPRPDFLERITAFHGYAAPGLIVGGFLVDAARRNLPEGMLFEALCETSWCLPDAVQLFTPCTTGNGWMRVKNLGRYALALYDKHTGHGFRASLDPARLEAYVEYRDWFLKRRPKREQDSDLLQDQIFEAGMSVLRVRPVVAGPGCLGHREKGAVAVCPVCREAYPARDGGVCLSCAGHDPYVRPVLAPKLTALPVEEASGRTALHDMTRVEPGVSKGVAFARGQVFTGSDLCRLQRMGRNRVYVTESGEPGQAFVHEDDAAARLAGALCAGSGLQAQSGPREGKITLSAAQAGLFTVDVDRLAALNAFGQVALSTLHDATLARAGQSLAGVRAIPLYIERETLDQALGLLAQSPVLAVRPLRRARAGALITGQEVVSGLVEDRFAPILRQKLEALGSSLETARLVPDDPGAIAAGVKALVDAGCDLIFTTAGMSVDPDDVTRQGLERAGVRDTVRGMPLLPGNMALVGRVEKADVIGVPACALYHRVTSLDVLLPRVLAGVPVTRALVARLGHGGFCMGCETCGFPHCPFGK
ncbi:FmdE family protein [Fundidesulfovibrio butyratiphilus]